MTEPATVRAGFAPILDVPVGPTPPIIEPVVPEPRTVRYGPTGPRPLGSLAQQDGRRRAD